MNCIIDRFFQAMLHEELNGLADTNTYGYLAMVVMMFKPGGVLPFNEFQVRKLRTLNNEYSLFIKAPLLDYR